MNKTLVLNASYEPIQVVEWRRAVSLIYREKAEVIAEHEETISSPSITINLPKVIRLKKYVNFITKIAKRPYSKTAVHKRDKYTCQYCGIVLVAKIATIDHILPSSRGGKSTWENTVTACQSCNCVKDNKTPQEAGMKLLSIPKRPDFWYFMKQEILETFEVDPE